MPSSITFARIADVNLSGHRVVQPTATGTVDYADWTTAPTTLLLTLQAALADTELAVLATGKHTEPSWSWTPGAPLYLGAAGVLTETVPTAAAGAAFLQQVASAITATSIFFDPKPPIALV